MTTLAQAQETLAAYLAAELDILTNGEESRLSSAGGIDRTLVTSKLADVRRGIQYWQGVFNRLESAQAGLPSFGGLRVSHASFGGAR